MAENNIKIRYNDNSSLFMSACVPDQEFPIMHAELQLKRYEGRLNIEIHKIELVPETFQDEGLLIRMRNHLWEAVWENMWFHKPYMTWDLQTKK